MGTCVKVTYNYSTNLSSPIREKVLHLESILEKIPQINIPINHYFADGVYAREMIIPANVVLTGAVHKTCHLSILSKGKIQVVSNDEVIELSAPATILAKAGSKRAIHAIEESVWTNIHATNETDIDKIVEELTESTAAELMGGKNNRQAKMSGILKLEE